MNDEEFEKHLKAASAIVATWPKWKQNILADSSKPMMSEPRTPVDNSRQFTEPRAPGDGHFTPKGRYCEVGHFYSVCYKDEDYYSQPVDDLLTVKISRSTGRVIGYVLKSI